MKRYHLFVFDQYYPRGGWSDFVNDFDELSDAIAIGQTGERAHVVDTHTRCVVWEYSEII